MTTLAEYIRDNFTDEEKETLRARFNEEPTFKHQRYTVFFPEKTGFSPLSLNGHVPAVGDKMAFNSHYVNHPDILEEYNHFSDYTRQWYVKSVTWVVEVSSKKKDRLLHDDSVRGEVIVDYHRWYYWWENLKLKYYYPIKRNIRKRLGW